MKTTNTSPKAFALSAVAALIVLVPAGSAASQFVPTHLFNTHQISAPPPTPAHLTVAAASPTSITLSWGQSQGDAEPAGYDIYVNGALRGTTGPLGFGSFNATLQLTGKKTPAPTVSYTVGSLSCGTVYTIAVTSYDHHGNQSKQNSLESTTKPCPSGSPSPTGTSSSGSTGGSAPAASSGSGSTGTTTTTPSGSSSGGSGSSGGGGSTGTTTTTPSGTGSSGGSSPGGSTTTKTTTTPTTTTTTTTTPTTTTTTTTTPDHHDHADHHDDPDDHHHPDHDHDPQRLPLGRDRFPGRRVKPFGRQQRLLGECVSVAPVRDVDGERLALAERQRQRFQLHLLGVARRGSECFDRLPVV